MAQPYVNDPFSRTLVEVTAQPAAGRLPPLKSTPAAVCVVGLRLGFAPASLKALAKFWPWASIAVEFAAAA